MLGPCRVSPLCLPPKTTFGESGYTGAFKSLVLDPCCGILLNAELQKIHLFKPALPPPHTNWMVYKIQTATSTSQHQELPFSKTQSFPIPQPSPRRPSGDISARRMMTVVRAGKPLGSGKRRDGCLATHSSLVVTKQRAFLSSSLLYSVPVM